MDESSLNLNVKRLFFKLLFNWLPGTDLIFSEWHPVWKSGPAAFIITEETARSGEQELIYYKWGFTISEFVLSEEFSVSTKNTFGWGGRGGGSVYNKHTRQRQIRYNWHPVVCAYSGLHYNRGEHGRHGEQELVYYQWGFTISEFEEFLVTTKNTFGCDSSIDLRSKDQRFESRPEHKKHLWEFSK